MSEVMGEAMVKRWPKPMTVEECEALRGHLRVEESEIEGADPAVHGLYDYYETTKRLLATVDMLKAELIGANEGAASLRRERDEAVASEQEVLGLFRRNRDRLEARIAELEHSAGRENERAVAAEAKLAERTADTALVTLQRQESK